MTEFISYFLMGFVAGIAAGWIASRLGVAWRDIQRSRVDKIPMAKGEQVGELKVRREI